MKVDGLDIIEFTGDPIPLEDAGVRCQSIEPRFRGDRAIRVYAGELDVKDPVLLPVGWFVVKDADTVHVVTPERAAVLGYHEAVEAQAEADRAEAEKAAKAAERAATKAAKEADTKGTHAK